MDNLEFMNLCKSSLMSNKDALDYVSERHLSNEAINTFDIGYCSSSLRPLIRQTEQDSDKEWLLNRIVFPIKDTYGDIVAFSGRSIDGSKPKYINTKYVKANYYYNLDKAKHTIYEKDFVVLVEGYMDAITLFMNGIENVVALCGVALKPRRLALLARYTKNIILMLDNDKTGKNATKSMIPMFLDSGFDVRTLYLGKYKDCDELLNGDNDAKVSFIKSIYDAFKASSSNDIDNLMHKLNDL